MTKSEAYDKIQELIKSYKSKFEVIGVRSECEIYFLNAKEFKEAASDENADSICASVTLITSKGEEELCGFDIAVDIERNGNVNESKLNSNIENFRISTDEFLAKIAISEDRDALIREVANREKTILQANIDSFNSDVKKLQTQTIILAVVSVLVIFLAVFAVLGN